MADETNSTPPPIHVEVAYAKPDVQVLLAIEVPLGTTATHAIQRSEIAQRFPELDRTDLKMGVFGKLCKPAQELRDGDRVEIYRPLIADPNRCARSGRRRANKPARAPRRLPNSPVK
jgi:putative ubiquitin-RnfH superfamily antitoxin RatB of RatAB toxin-antitoxin module